ncbi:MAG TPA: hypothetical protein VNA88_16450 [Candidatus Kapabacteria bacterium]|nr:hypothetical protein [Candidatus Kapabacteria bacterium]
MLRLSRLSGISPWIWTALLFALLAIAVQYLPLTRELHYELSAVAALWTSLGVGLAALVAARRQRDRASAGDETMRALGPALATTAAPLLVALVANLLRGTCGLCEGMLWYVLLVPPSAFIALAVARLSRNLTRRRWLQAVWFLALWGAPMLRGAIEALTGPHIYLYAWQIGFFPGGSWDPELPITPLLLLYRASHVLIAALLVLVLASIEATRSGRTRPRGAVLLPAAMAAAIVMALYPLRSEMGLARTDSWLRATLGDSVRTRYATIYYDATSTDSLDIWRAANYTDFYVWHQARAIGLEARQIEPITFYAFASGAEQKRLVGTSSASFTKPWRRTLNLSFDRVEATLEHELAHIVLEPYGNLLGISWSNGILEGSAVAIEHADDAGRLHRLARAAYDAGLAPPVTRVMSASGFASHRASLSYTIAGSFCRWLLDTHGPRRFRRAYASGDLAEHYDRSLDSLAADHARFLAALPPTDPELGTTVRSLFGGGSFFLQRCLRRTATLSGEGYRALGEERYDDALEHFRASLREGITAGARAGIIRTLHSAGRYDELVDSMAVYVDRDSLGYQLLALRIELSDALRPGAERDEILRSMLRVAPDEWTRARAAMRLLLAGERDSVTRRSPEMIDYFRRPMSVAARIAMLASIDAHDTSLDLGSRALLRLMRAQQQGRSSPVLAVAQVPSRVLDSSVGDATADFAACALLRTLNDAHALRISADGRLDATERREGLHWIEAAYRSLSPAPRAAWPGELVLADRPRATFAAFLQYLDWHGAIATPRARR